MNVGASRCCDRLRTSVHTSEFAISCWRRTTAMRLKARTARRTASTGPSVDTVHSPCGRGRSNMKLNNERGRTTASGVPHLLTAAEVAELLRTSKIAIYAMVERGQLPGVVRVGRRVLVRESDLL